MSIKNASTLPKIYYGLHMVEGVAEYAEPGKQPYRIMIGEEAIKNMDPSFAGKPVYVHHVDGLNLDKIHEADGYVTESFFNKADGKHWAKFIVVSDRGHEAIRSGWKLSNAYIPAQMSGGGLWHGVEYSKEIMSGEYEHLAIVPNPRYEESVILTPEQFKAYNSQKEQELLKIANSKGDRPMLSFFKRSKVENSADLENTVVVLPESKKEVTIAQLVVEADKIQNMAGYANGEHMVKIGDSEMTVNELVGKHAELLKNMAEEEEKKKNEAAAEEEKKKNAEKPEEEKKEIEGKEEEKKENAEEEEKKKNEDVHVDIDSHKGKEEDKKEQMKNAHFDALKNAPMTVIREAKSIDLSADKTARGKSRYGSN